MKMRMTCLALLLCLLLTACGGKEPDSQGRTSLLGEAAGLEEEEVLVTVDGREVPAWRYLYWLAWTCGQMRERYESSGTALDWDTPVSGGTLAQYVKDQALADTVLYAVVENLAEKAGYAHQKKLGPKQPCRTWDWTKPRWHSWRTWDGCTAGCMTATVPGRAA